MTYQPFLIANARVGKETDIQPWILPDDAFPTLENAYLYRGVIRKKGGNLLLGRLGVQNPTLVASRGAGNTVVNLSLTPAPVEPGSIIITDGTTTFTDDGSGGFTITGGTGTVNAPTNYTTGAINITFTSANPGAKITATFFRLVDNSSPCMGLCTQEVNVVNNNSLIAFDMIYAYQFNNPTGQFVNISNYKVATVGARTQSTTNSVVWTGNNSQFFDYMNYQKAFFETNNVPGSHLYTITNISNAAAAQVTTSAANNFAVGDLVYFNNVVGMTQINNLTGKVTISGNPFTVDINSTGFSAYASGGVAWSQTLSKASGGDGIRWYDNTGWVNFNPPLDNSGTPQILMGSLLLFAYKGRMVVLNTWEASASTAAGSAINFPNRARYSQPGTVYYGSVLPAGNVITNNAFNAWYNSPGLGGFLDAPTQESIVGAEFIKDVLVVYFERSTYRLYATNQPNNPFVWEKINTEIGAESTFSTVAFDKEILSIGTNGVYSCDSLNIERIDQKIPDEVFNFGQANNGITRIHGIRDFYSQFVYWTYVDPDNATATFPNKLLIYNYIDGSWAEFDSYYTAFGYYQVYANQTWGNTNEPWSAMTIPWGGGELDVLFPYVVAGNQEGFVFQLGITGDDDDFPVGNTASLVIQSISNANPSVFTVPNHNLSFEDVDDDVVGENYVLITGTGIVALDGNIFEIANPTQNTFTLIDSTGTNFTTGALYTFGGRVTTVENFKIVTKRFTPFIQSGEKVRVGYVDIFIGNETSDGAGQPAITMFTVENEELIQIPAITQTISQSDPNSGSSLKFWKRVYINQTAQSIQVQFQYDPFVQIFSTTNRTTDMAIYGLNFWMAPAGRLVR